MDIPADLFPASWLWSAWLACAAVIALALWRALDDKCYLRGP